MPDEGFLRRWARRKSESRLGQDLPAEPVGPFEALPEQGAPPQAAAAPAPTSAPADAREAAVDAAADATAAPPLPTMDDVASLTRDSDYSAFVARGVDMAVRRSALKKLFADPHFKAMDGLDIYIDDYNKPSPLSETMLASLRHAARLFERVADDDAAQPAETAADGDPQDQRHPPETETR